MEATLDNQPQDMSENRGNKTPGQNTFARRRVYTVVGDLFFKFDEMRLR